jgi:hypothetical protein
MAKIDPEKVQEVFFDSLFRDEEVNNGKNPEMVKVEGIRLTLGFHPGRLEIHRAEVLNWLTYLPLQFRKSSGGGWSFLNACQDINDEQWTGLHERMEQLFCLGLGLDLVACVIPREMWDALPGGMPYYRVEI